MTHNYTCTHIMVSYQVQKMNVFKVLHMFLDPEANDEELEKWEKTLFKELGTLMYRDPAQGSNIVSRLTQGCRVVVLEAE